MRVANTYALDTVGSAQNVTRICSCKCGNPNELSKPWPIAGSGISFTNKK